jgi:hypothetical protein
VLTPEMIRACRVLDASFDPDSPMSAFRANPLLGLTRLQKPSLTDFSAYQRSPVRSMSVPSSIADFFIEGFAVDQINSMKQVPNKNFGTPVVLQFSLPAITPIAVRSEKPSEIVLGFYDTPNMSANETFQLVSVILTVISRMELFVVDFTNVDRSAFTREEIIDLAEDYDLVLLKYDGETDDGLDVQDFTLKILKTQWNLEREETVRSGIEEMFRVAYVTYCKQCGLVYAPTDSTPCCVYYHSGKQLEFSPGQLEEVELDDDDQPVVLVKWSCCGEVLADEPGCSVVEKDSHEPDEERKNFSKYAISTAPVFNK